VNFGGDRKDKTRNGELMFELRNEADEHFVRFTSGTKGFELSKQLAEQFEGLYIGLRRIT
jgi:hypothetical protein